MEHDNNGRIRWELFAFGLCPIKAAIKFNYQYQPAHMRSLNRRQVTDVSAKGELNAHGTPIRDSNQSPSIMDNILLFKVAQRTPNSLEVPASVGQM